MDSINLYGIEWDITPEDDWDYIAPLGAVTVTITHTERGWTVTYAWGPMEDPQYLDEEGFASLEAAAESVARWLSDGGLQ